MDKLTQIKEWTLAHNLSFTYISDPKTIQYLTGYYNAPHERIMALVVFGNQEAFMFAPNLQVEEIQKSSFDGPVYGYADREDPWARIAEQVHRRIEAVDHIGFEADNFPVGRARRLNAALGSGQFDTDVTDVLDGMKMIKTAAEIKEMEAAGREADFCFEVGFKAVKVGVSENQVAAEIKYALMKHGIMFNSFPTLVQAGVHASQPHSFTSDNRINANELVLFDLGTVHNGYCSDASRTIAVGQPDAKQIDIYNTVLAAQEAAQRAAKPGMTAGDLDQVARDVIERAGYGKYFIHRLGHGIGLSTHEAPAIKGGSQLVLKAGMCFSLEPGIYVPGVAGVRIEDCVHLTDEGAVPFTHTPKELKFVPAVN